MKLEILHQGKHHIVVNKPANMVVVSGRGAPRPTLLDVMQEQFGKGIRPVHRLDRVTTGCCIFAKSLYGQQALSDAFRRRLIDKRYIAIVERVLRSQALVIDARLQRVDAANTRKGPLASQTVSDEGKRSLTRIRVWAQSQSYSAVEARPETGRMHQIRAHLAHVGHPIVGDKQYHAKTQYSPHAIALHAFGISFPAPDGGRYHVVAPLPKLFLATLDQLDLVIEPKWNEELQRFEQKKSFS